MIRTSRAVTVFCLFAVVALSCESAYQELNSIDDLKKIDFGRSVPKHTLLLLHWFANTVDFDMYDYNGDIYLTFDPNTDFGSHYYGNFERMLDAPRLGYEYYTVGSFSRGTSEDLPHYVLQPPVREYEGTNRDRIIFSVRENRIDRVYITQHDRQRNNYDPEHTYQISTNLLQQIRQFSVENQRSLSELRDQHHSSADDDQLRDISNTWGYNLACVGLLLFIVIQDKYSNNRRANNTPQTVPRQTDFVLNMQDVSNNTATEDCCTPECIAFTILVLIIAAVIGIIIFRKGSG